MIYIKRITKKSVLFSFLCFYLIPNTFIAQESEEEFSKHHHIVLSIGHGFVPSGTQSGGAQEFVLIPIIGFDYEFLFNEKTALAWRNDFEISTYIIIDDEGNEIERENPFASSLVFQYNPIKGLGFFMGPGIEFEREENFVLATFGVSYEVQFADTWDFAPELAYVLKGGHTGAFTFSLCVGKRFGK